MTPYFQTDLGKLYHGDALDILKQLDGESVQCVVTSPPYWGLRDYGVDGQIGLEKTPQEYVSKLVALFREVKRVLKDDGTVWCNLGDSYVSSPAGNFGENMPAPADGGRYRENKPKMNYDNLKPKNLVGIPWRVAFALQADGWYLRQDIIWHKPNPMPESVTDRCTKAHEYIFLLSKNKKYYYDAENIKEKSFSQPGTAGSWDGNRDFGLPNGQARFAKPNLGGSSDGFRNKRSVWSINTQPFPEAHFAVFPQKLIEPCILAGSKKGDIILDPFSGAGTTAVMAGKYKRQWIGIELNEDYLEIAKKRIKRETRQLTIT